MVQSSQEFKALTEVPVDLVEAISESTGNGDDLPF
jgi:hypothetical protein